MRINSIRFKTSILFSMILCIILMVNSVFIYFGLRRILFRDMDNKLQIKAEQISSIVNAYAEADKRDRHPLSFLRNSLAGGSFFADDGSIIDELWETDVKALNLKQDYFRIIKPGSKGMLISSNMTKDINAVFSEMPFDVNAVHFETVKEKFVKGRFISFPFTYQNRVPLVIQLLTPVKAINGILMDLVFFMAGSILFIVLLTSSLGIYFTHSILKPVSSLTHVADKISHTDLSVRLEDKEADWELRNLIRSFNLMISRLEASFAHINEFSSHVAHELKTPLAIIRGEIELALSEPSRSNEEYKKVLEDSLEEMDRLIRIIKDLLLLAKLDYKPEIFRFEKINLLDFMNELHSQAEILAGEKDIQVAMNLPEGQIIIEADPVHLRRLFLNIINNAIKFTPQSGSIQIRLDKGPKTVKVAIKDSGLGIPESDLNKIFTQFYRVRHEAAIQGNGLGLPIAQSIAQAHKGDISVESQLHQGSVFTVTLPLSS